MEPISGYPTWAHLDTPGQSLDLPGVLPGTWNIQVRTFQVWNWRTSLPSSLIMTMPPRPFIPMPSSSPPRQTTTSEKRDILKPTCGLWRTSTRTLSRCCVGFWRTFARIGGQKLFRMVRSRQGVIKPLRAQSINLPRALCDPNLILSYLALALLHACIHCVALYSPCCIPWFQYDYLFPC
ncbi:hypothetical protein DFP72DRAFT_1054379, partial [Ephemerocybe angulata]